MMSLIGPEDVARLVSQDLVVRYASAPGTQPRRSRYRSQQSSSTQYARSRVAAKATSLFQRKTDSVSSYHYLLLSDLVSWILGGLLRRVLAHAFRMTWSLYGGRHHRRSRQAPERSTHHMLTLIYWGSLRLTWSLYRDLLHGPSRRWDRRCVSSGMS
jgi:hypothetical protein